MWCMEVPARASEAAATLARLFEQDARLAKLQNDAQHRLQGWSEHDARNANVHELANPARSR
jgi:hypothetical protein